MTTVADVIVIGGGIIGLSTALELNRRFSGMSLVVLEKEPAVGMHQSGHNSGVVHSGLYYRPGSLKARLCVEGAERLFRFCADNGIPHDRPGKVVVAADPSELPALRELERRGHANGLRGLRSLSTDELAEIEPHVAGVGGLHVPSTGIVDYGKVARTIAQLLQSRGVEVRPSFRVEAISVGSMLSVRGPVGEVKGRSVVNCAGLYADRVAEMMGVRPSVRIVPFRGEYYDIAGPSAGLVRASIYPVPDPRLPFLGVHLTRTIDGTVHAGPNAVLGLAREGSRWGDFLWSDLREVLGYEGFRRLARRHWRSGMSEMARSVSKRSFVKAVRRLVPHLEGSDLTRGASGVRAQAVTSDGGLAEDFVLETSERAVHVLNAPSPAATACFAIADYLADRIAEALGLGPKG